MTNPPPLRDRRRWDELESFGASLSAHPNEGLPVATLRELLRLFELPKSAEEEAVRVVIEGLLAVAEPAEAMADEDD